MSSPLQNQIVLENSSSLYGNLKHVDSHVDDYITGSPSLQGREIMSKGRCFAGGVGICDGSALVLEIHASDNSSKFMEASSMQDANVRQSFHYGKCKILENHESCASTEVVTDNVDIGSSHLERKQMEEDGKNDDMLGDMFAFSEEG